MTNASSVTFSSLDGETDQAYELLIEGLLTQSGSQRHITLQPNGVSTNQRCVWRDSYTFNDATPVAEANKASELLLGIGFGTSVTAMLTRATMRVRTGIRRMVDARWVDGDNGAANLANQAEGLAAGMWSDTSTAVTSMVVSFGGGTFTGRVSLRAV